MNTRKPHLDYPYLSIPDIEEDSIEDHTKLKEVKDGTKENPEEIPILGT